MRNRSRLDESQALRYPGLRPWLVLLCGMLPVSLVFYDFGPSVTALIDGIRSHPLIRREQKCHLSPGSSMSLASGLGCAIRVTSHDLPDRLLNEAIIFRGTT